MFQRYAVFVTPTGQLATAGAAWLGWDIAKGCAVPHPEVAELDLARLTKTPRKYGLHGTIKPPFFLAAGTDQAELEAALRTLCTAISPVTLEGLSPQMMGDILALIPLGDPRALAQMAGKVVMRLDRFRRPASPEELSRRRQRALSPLEEANLTQWGYPYVLDAFRFHITLSGRIEANKAQVLAQASRYFAPHLESPFKIDSLTLAGQDEAGLFHEINRFAFEG